MTTTTPAVKVLCVSIDQLSGAAAFIGRNWGTHGYTFTHIESPTRLVSVFDVRHSDGSRFSIVVDRYGNARELPEHEPARGDCVRNMHIEAARI
jgi:hypothetical protein